MTTFNSETQSLIKDVVNQNEGAAVVIGLIYINISNTNKIHEYVSLLKDMEIIGVKIWHFYNKICNKKIKYMAYILEQWSKIIPEKRKTWSIEIDDTDNIDNISNQDSKKKQIILYNYLN